MKLQLNHYMEQQKFMCSAVALLTCALAGQPGALHQSWHPRPSHCLSALPRVSMRSQAPSYGLYVVCAGRHWAQVEHDSSKQRASSVSPYSAHVAQQQSSSSDCGYDSLGREYIAWFSKPVLRQGPGVTSSHVYVAVSDKLNKPLSHRYE